MPAPHPLEFRRRAVDLARAEQTVAVTAKDLNAQNRAFGTGSQADADEGKDSARLTSNERAELTELRKKSKRLEVENEILKRAPQRTSCGRTSSRK